MTETSAATKPACKEKSSTMSRSVKLTLTPVGAPIVQVIAPARMMSELATFAVVIVSFSSQRANIRLKMSKIEKIEPSADCGPSDQAAILRPLAGPYKTMPKNQTSSRGIFSPHIGIRGFGYARPNRCTTIVNAKSAAPGDGEDDRNREVQRAAVGLG